ncbi:Ulp1-like peptidase [Cucumis melo var. makuwa]|uniref:Ulp1-like peptidase n=1 Tax=Cucumis melo var. makuwa TaxID=1194695 RepID=A0A5D3CTY9_CUCMM|nr:Ulp1-like peptidase [Cucumis melo var. makuwa]
MAVPSNKYFSSTVSCQVHKIDSLIKDKLTKEQLQMFNKSVFGPPLNVNMVFNGQLIYHFLLRQIPEEANPNGIYAVKIALVLFIETVMVGKNKKTQFDMDILEKVDDEEVFKNFDWSNFFYTRLLNSLKTILQGKKEAYELKRAKSSRAVAYYNINGYVLAFQLSTQEKAFIESRIRGDDNMEMEDEPMVDVDNINNTTTDDTTTNNNLQSTSSPQLSPRKKKQTVADESVMHPMTKKKSRTSNDNKHQGHSKSYERLKKNIKEVHKDVSALTSIVCKMDDTIRKQSLEPSEMKQMLKRLLQNREDMMSNDQPCIEEQHTQDHNVETKRQHQEESGSDISIDGKNADLLLTIRDISDNLNAQSQKKKDLPEMITTLPLLSQPLPLCEILPSLSSALNQPAMAPFDQTVQTHKVPPSISIVDEES